MSLAGAQTKLAGAMTSGGPHCIPGHGSPSTNILKTRRGRDNRRRPKRGVLPKRGRANANPGPPIHHGAGLANRTYSLVQRYDRTDKGDRGGGLHQEDFCQGSREAALGEVEFQPTPGSRDQLSAICSI